MDSKQIVQCYGAESAQIVSNHASSPVQLLPDELMLLIGEQGLRKSTQAALCLVSRRFQQLFMSLLYHELCFDHLTEEILIDLNKLPENSHLRLVKRLVLRAGYNELHSNNRPIDYHAVVSGTLRLVPKLKSLRSFE